MNGGFGTLDVVVQKAIALQDKDALSGASDPFVVLSVGSDRRETSTKNGTLNPEWNERFQFRVPLDPRTSLASVSLRVECFDRDLGKSRDFLGGGDVDLTDITRGETRAAVLPMPNGGCLFLELLARDFGRQSANASPSPSPAYNQQHPSHSPASTHPSPGTSPTSQPHHEPAQYYAGPNAGRAGGGGTGTAGAGVSPTTAASSNYNYYSPSSPSSSASGSPRASTGRLRVKVWKATGLKDTDLIGKGDPYVVLTLNGEKRETKVRKGTGDPVWDEEFVFAAPLVQAPWSQGHSESTTYITVSKLQVECRDKDLFGKGDLLGTGDVDLQPLVMAQKRDIALPIGNAGGCLFMEVEALDFGRSLTDAASQPQSQSSSSYQQQQQQQRYGAAAAGGGGTGRVSPTSPTAAIVRVRVVKATGLGTGDPTPSGVGETTVELRAATDRQCTRPARGGSNPIWNQVLELRVPTSSSSARLNDKLFVECFEQSGRILGRGELELRSLVAGQPKDYVVPMDGRGCLVLQLELVPLTDPNTGGGESPSFQQHQQHYQHQQNAQHGGGGSGGVVGAPPVAPVAGGYYYPPQQHQQQQQQQQQQQLQQRYSSSNSGNQSHQLQPYPQQQQQGGRYSSDQVRSEQSEQLGRCDNMRDLLGYMSQRPEYAGEPPVPSFSAETQERLAKVKEELKDARAQAHGLDRKKFGLEKERARIEQQLEKLSEEAKEAEMKVFLLTKQEHELQTAVERERQEQETQIVARIKDRLERDDFVDSYALQRKLMYEEARAQQLQVERDRSLHELGELRTALQTSHSSLAAMEKLKQEEERRRKAVENLLKAERRERETLQRKLDTALRGGPSLGDTSAMSGGGGLNASIATPTGQALGGGWGQPSPSPAPADSRRPTSNATTSNVNTTPTAHRSAAVYHQFTQPQSQSQSSQLGAGPGVSVPGLTSPPTSPFMSPPHSNGGGGSYYTGRDSPQHTPTGTGSFPRRSVSPSASHY